MSSAKSLRYRQRKKRQEPYRKEKESRGRKMLNTILSILAIVGFAIALLTLFPRITISNNVPIDPDDPFSTPFLISNEGYVPLFSVQFLMAIREVNRKGGGGIIGTPDFKTRFTAPDMKSTAFWPTDSYSFYAGRILRAHGSLESADIAIIVQYRPFLVPFKRERIFRFITQRGPDNRLYWMQRPSSD